MKAILRRILLFCLFSLLLVPCALSEEAHAVLATHPIPNKPGDFLIECSFRTDGDSVSEPRIVLKTGCWIRPHSGSIRILKGESIIYAYSGVFDEYVWFIPEDERPTGDLPLSLQKTGQDTYMLTWHVQSGTLTEASYTLQFTASVDTKEGGFETGVLYPAFSDAILEYASGSGILRKSIDLPHVYIPLGAKTARSADSPPAASASLSSFLPNSGGASAPLFCLAAVIFGLISLTALRMRRRMG